jgi:hypothetical protein
MHKEILTEEQLKFLPTLKLFSKDFGLVGGTALALHIGHRRSLDFDLFTDKEFSNFTVHKKIKTFAEIQISTLREPGQFTFVAGGIKLTFFQYPFKIDYPENFEDIIKLPDIMTLAAMKAFALSRRSKWKDYVDLYFVMRVFFGLGDIIKKAETIFSTEFNEKAFRAQLAYLGEIDYTEKVEYMKGFEIEDEVVKKELIEFSLS